MIEKRARVLSLDLGEGVIRHCVSVPEGDGERIVRNFGSGQVAHFRAEEEAEAMNRRAGH